MAPLTRARAEGNVPNQLMVQYYAERATAGLIITEGTAPSPNGLGYARIPGIYTREQIEGWKMITTAVHENDGKIFLQLMHTGRVSHPENMEKGARVVAPSAVRLNGQMYTDTKGPLSYPEPEEMTLADISQAQDEFLQAAINAIEAGFDGVEIHSANGYLADQFLNTATNKRHDAYGGSIENRTRFTREITGQIVKAIGAERVGIRLSPYSTFNDTEVFDGMERQFLYLVDELKQYDLAYVHLVNNTALGSPDVNEDIFKQIRKRYKGNLIMNGGYDRISGEEALIREEADLISYGRSFIANPDLPYRFSYDLPLNHPDPDTFYTPGEKGYTDYPAWAESQVAEVQ